MTSVDMKAELKSQSGKLHFGWYEANVKTTEGLKKVVCEPLTQSDYAEGWVPVLPQKRTNSTIYNWNVNFAQLPEYLWSRCHLKYNSEGKPYYIKVKDGIYMYTIIQTEYDELFFALQKEMSKPVSDLLVVSNLYSQLHSHTSGWLLIRAKRMLNKQ